MRYLCAIWEIAGTRPWDGRLRPACNIGRVSRWYRRFTLAPGGARRSRLRLYRLEPARTKGCAGSRAPGSGPPGRRRSMSSTSDTRITGYEPLLSPAALLDELPLTDDATATVERSRGEVRAVLDGEDDRLLVIAGPCSVHDTRAALEYAGQLRDIRDRHHGDLLIVMRVYFEKPRTVTGWKRLINDPGMDGGH